MKYNGVLRQIANWDKGSFCVSLHDACQQALAQLLKFLSSCSVASITPSFDLKQTIKSQKAIRHPKTSWRPNSASIRGRPSRLPHGGDPQIKARFPGAAIVLAWSSESFRLVLMLGALIWHRVCLNWGALKATKQEVPSSERHTHVFLC